MNYIRKLASFSLGTVITALISALSIPIFTRMMTPSDYGEVNLFISIATIVGVVSMGGFDQGFIRFYNNSNRKSLFKKSIFFSFIFFVVNSLITLIIIANSKALFSFESSALLLIIYVFFTIFLRYLTLVLRMQQEGLKFSIIQILTKLFEFLIIFLLLMYIQNSSAYYIIGVVLSQFTVTIISLFITFSFWKIDDSKKNKVNNKTLVQYSIPLLIAGIITILFQTADKLIISHFLSFEELGIYIAAFKIVALLNILQTTFTLLWTPVSFEKYHDDSNNKNFFSQISSLVALSMFSVAATIVLLKDYIVILLGNEYREAVNLIPILVFLPLMYTISETTVIGINFKLKSFLHIIISSGVLVFLIIAMTVLVPPFGLTGAAISVNLAYVLFFYLRTFFGLHYFKFDIKLKSITFLILLFYIWITILFFSSSNLYLVIGGLVYFVFIFLLFKNEIILIIKAIEKRGKRR